VIPLTFAATRERLSVLCLGAHSDDIEIGAGGLILSLAATVPELEVRWCVASAMGEREEEARASARDFLAGVTRSELEMARFEDSFFPEQSRDIKQWLTDVRTRASPDIVLVHRAADAHQDHRELNRITWNLFRDHLIFEYEIPKWDGDLGQPNFYVPLEPDVLERKFALLMQHFGSQRSKDWFDLELFRALSRIRGMECRAQDGHAEAFFVRKAVFLPPDRTQAIDPTV
jgi:LmbE family N-acetylglucosaminyl deacetylase